MKIKILFANFLLLCSIFVIINCASMNEAIDKEMAKNNTSPTSSTPLISAKSHSNAQPPTDWSQYQEANFKKLTSGAFIQEYKGKYIKLKCRFLGQGAGIVPEGYDSSKYVGFMMTGYGDYSQGYTTNAFKDMTNVINGIIAKDKSDVVFDLETQQNMIAYGKVVPITSSNEVKSFSDVVLEVYKIDPLDKMPAPK